jgi:hypothetical protein
VNTTLSLLAFYLIYGLLLSGKLANGWAFVSFSAPGFLFLAYRLLKNMPGGEDEG